MLVKAPREATVKCGVVTISIVALSTAAELREVTHIANTIGAV